jgi:NADP-dependent 3-hydroxy acid dehydrogenase YdfG
MNRPCTTLSKMSSLVWLITGCSPGGLGEYFVRDVLARGDKVIATARKLEKIKHLEQTGAAVLQLDITDNQQRLNETIAKAVEIYGKVDVLLNNAAYIAIGNWEDLEYAPTHSGQGLSLTSEQVRRLPSTV